MMVLHATLPSNTTSSSNNNNSNNNASGSGATGGAGANTVSSVSAASSTANTINNNASSSTVDGRLSMRRRRSKGTIAGYANPSNNADTGSRGSLHVSSLRVSTSTSNAGINAGGGTVTHTATGFGSSAPGGGGVVMHRLNQSSGASTAASSAAATTTTTGGGGTGSTGAAPKPSPTARLVWVCVQNALYMGTCTQLQLCPPGRARRELQAVLRQRKNPPPFYPLAAENRFVKAYDTSVEEWMVKDEEDASSGDDDDLREYDDFYSETPLLEPVSQLLREPLYTPTTAMDSSSLATKSLPFNRRKLRFFDAITTHDRSLARGYLRTEWRRLKQRAAIQILQQLNRPSGGAAATDTIKNDHFLTKLDATMTPSLAAALLLESLDVNNYESVEGMAACYDGIVAAGMALLEDPKPSKAQILAALTPLLITQLHLTSGEVILALAKLRRMCGTFRYQRRFVQRIGPLLVRPGLGATWCLRQQQDMEAILEATELILDAAFDIFGNGWYERGQLILADSKRAQTLDTAARQLRSLSQEPVDSLKIGFTTHSGWLAAKKRKEMNVSSEALAEWEVVAVVRQIKVSISSVMKTDWSKVTAAQVDVHSRTNRGRGFMKRQAMQVDSPKGIPSSPRSPNRPISYSKTPLSPPALPTITASSPEAMETVFGPSFSDRSVSPPPRSQDAPKSPPTPHRTNKTEGEPSSPRAAGTFLSLPTLQKSPTSPPREQWRQSEAVAVQPPLSPKRTRNPRDMSIQASVTPLSPSASSVGTTASPEIVTYRPSTSSIHAAPNASYRVLTSTAAERKRTVAACRALRAQIQRFEDAFVQLHGRPPKGNVERAPLATTYAQYREWKRAIRADAACRIQALLRGALTRSKILNSNFTALARIVMRRPGRLGYVGSGSVMNRIGIPLDIGSSDGLSSTGVPSSDYIPSAPSLAPQWASSVVRRRPSAGDRLPNEGFAMSVAQVRRPGSSPPPSTAATTTSTSSATSVGSYDGAGWPLDQLQARKRELKDKLKQYDMNFARRHGRMPVKAEKEPIRHLYESYNALKSQIALMEQEGKTSASPSAVLSAAMSNRSDSPSANSDSGNSGTGADEVVIRSTQVVPLPVNRPRRRVSPESSPPPMSESRTGGGILGSQHQDLNALKAEKTQLHQMLRSYERDFFEEHRRQVSSFSDIRPVASQYRRYKEIKRAIAALQQQSSP